MIQQAASAESQNDHTGAEQYYRQALWIKPGNWQLWFNLGVQLSLQQRPVPSGKCMRKVLALEALYLKRADLAASQAANLGLPWLAPTTSYIATTWRLPTCRRPTRPGALQQCE